MPGTIPSAEYLPATLCGVSLQPWLRYQKLQTFAGIELAAADYAPLSEEVLLYRGDAGRDVLRAEPVPIKVQVTAPGRLNAVVWCWEVELGSPSHTLTSHAAAPKTHWRQAIYLLPTPRQVDG